MIIDVTLPEWAWLDGGEHEPGGDRLLRRNVIMHVRSATVMEIFKSSDFVARDSSVIVHQFRYETLEYSAVLHYSATVDDREELEALLAKASEWFCRFLEWESGNIISDINASLN